MPPVFVSSLDYRLHSLLTSFFLSVSDNNAGWPQDEFVSRKTTSSWICAFTDFIHILLKLLDVALFNILISFLWCCYHISHELSYFFLWGRHYCWLSSPPLYDRKCFIFYFLRRIISSYIFLLAFHSLIYQSHVAYIELQQIYCIVLHCCTQCMVKCRYKASSLVSYGFIELTLLY